MLARAALAFAPGVVLGPAPAAQEPPRRPNVLLLVADDLGKRIGCYGDPVAATPSLDRLAALGVRFERAYCQAPLCNPSRVALLTGLRPPTTGVYGNEDDWRKRPAIERTLPELFRGHGYEAISIGKVFHSSKSDETRWSRVVPPARVPRGPIETEQQTVELPLYTNPSARNPISWGSAGEDDLDQIDGRYAEAAVNLLKERPADAPPFLLAVGFARPHSPFLSPAPYVKRYDPARMPLPSAPEGDLDDVPRAALDGVAIGKDLSAESWARILCGYYACVSYVDACVGRILRALEESPHGASTIVVFTSDHGLLLGEHSLWLKDVLFEEATACPLIVVTPDHRGAGRASRALVELVDLFPTLVELCGLPAPAGIEGTSLAPLLEDPERKWKSAAFSHTSAGTSVRTERWRFTQWKSGELELYDHEEDPGEFRNLAGDEERGKIVEELRGVLAGGWQAARPSR